MLNYKSLQLQYEGFLYTPFLWSNNDIKNLEQFKVQRSTTSSFDVIINNNPRLGKLVERFVTHQLQQNSTIKILIENIQIQDNKTTLGELDCILLQDDTPIHLEIIYKFYLYDETVSNIEINRWIGPNRRDSFTRKLDKLIDKQLPLLYHSKTAPLLKSLNLSSEKIKQQVYFKAQLFVPLKDYGKTFPEINNDCIQGFYISFKETSMYSDCKFHIPRKHNWLVKPHSAIDWLNYIDFKIKLIEFISKESAPLCWLKKPNGELFKFFVVWW